MLLLLLDSLLLIFITFSLGGISRALLSKWLMLDLQVSFMEVFLLGLMLSSVYFNLLSQIIPVNWLTLIPLILISIIWQFRRKELTVKRIRTWFNLNFQGKSGLLLIILFLIGLHFLVSPYNHDSADYHYHTVYWYENYKVIPGLGNVHGRLAFNAMNFILSAPYSFTHLVGQSLYPLNGVLVLMFYLWVFQNILKRSSNWGSIVYLIVAILFFRPLLANIPSPASEPLVTITVAVVFFRLLDLIENRKHKDIRYFAIPLLISFFAVTAKLTSIPVLLISAVWMFFFIPRQQFSVYLKLGVAAAIIVLPWIGRNIILSGYIVYPFYMIDVLNVDWKVPRDIAILDYAFGTVGSYGHSEDVFKLNGISEWLPVWMEKHLAPRRWIDFSVFVLSLTSFFTWMIVWRKKRVDKALFVLWLCAFIGEMIWFLRAPEFRFGMGYLLMTFCIPLINLSKNYPLPERRFLLIAGTVLVLSLINYSIRATLLHPRFNTHGLEMLWLKPLRDKRYTSAYDMQTAKIEDLGHGVKLFHRDPEHDCIHIYDQPCMMWEYGAVELRGTKITEGFRNKRNDVRKIFPFVFEHQW